LIQQQRQNLSRIKNETMRLWQTSKTSAMEVVVYPEKKRGKEKRKRKKKKKRRLITEGMRNNLQVEREKKKELKES